MSEEKKIEETTKKPTEEEMQSFIDEIVAVQKKHGLTLEPTIKPSFTIGILKEEK